MSSSSNTFLNIQEAAEFLRIKQSTLYAWVHQRRVPYRKHGRKVIFYRNDLLLWSERQQIPPMSELTPFHKEAIVSHNTYPLWMGRSLKTEHAVDERPNLKKEV